VQVEGEEKVKFIYQFLRILNDINAALRGKIGQRLTRRILGRAFGKGVMRRIK
jgi:hypothetical protein